MLFNYRTPATLQDLASIRFIKWMIFPHDTNIAKTPRIKKNTNNIIQRAVDISPNQVATLKKYLNNLPGIFQQILLTELMKQLITLFKMKHKSARVDERTSVILEVFFTEKIQVLTLDGNQIKTFGGIFGDKGHMLDGLTDLRLDIDYDDLDKNGSCDSMEPKILAFLKHFLGLRRLSIGFCTDKTLCCIIKNCKLIEKLELYNCDLIFHRKLVELLSELPNLISIDLHVDFRPVMDGREVQEQRKQCLELISTKKQFYIRSFTCLIFDSSKQYLPMIIEKYPLIRSLTLNSINARHLVHRSLSKESVTGLKNLECLDVSFFKFYKSGLKEVLENVGGNLKKLVLRDVSEVDLNAMKVISLKFPMLEDLTITRCIYKEDDTTNNLIEFSLRVIALMKNKVPAFPRLKRFMLTTLRFSKKNIPCISFVLSNCPYIEDIYICIHDVTMPLLYKVVHKTSISYLKHFSLYLDKDLKFTF